MRLFSGSVLLVVGCVCLSLTSCAAVVAGGAGAAAAYTYASGWLERDYEAPLDKAYQASLEALQESGLEVVEKSKDITSAEIKAKTEQRTYWVDLASKTQNMTTISVRAGYLGDEPASRKIHQEIAGKL